MFVLKPLLSRIHMLTIFRLLLRLPPCLLLDLRAERKRRNRNTSPITPPPPVIYNSAMDMSTLPSPTHGSPPSSPKKKKKKQKYEGYETGLSENMLNPNQTLGDLESAWPQQTPKGGRGVLSSTFSCSFRKSKRAMFLLKLSAALFVTSLVLFTLVFLVVDNTCPEGFIQDPAYADARYCIDIDECQFNNMCGKRKQCVNQIPYFKCIDK